MNINIFLRRYMKTKISRNKSRSAGFTILELMIASSVFAVVLLIVAIGAISFTNSYYKGITSSEVQSVTRTIMSQVSQSIEFSESLSILTPNNGVAGYCIDNTMYSYELGLEVVNPPNPDPSQDQNNHGLVVNTNASCSSSTTPSLPETPALPQFSQELLNQHMRLGEFEITQLSSNLYSINLEVIYGDNAILSPIPSSSLPLGSSQWSAENCAPGIGSQFCAISELTTTVEQRLN